MEHNLVSIDPGVHEHYLARWADNRLRAVACVPVGQEICWPTSDYCTDLAIEVPQVYPGIRKEDPNDLINLAISAGIAIGSCQWRLVTRYLPCQWKGQTPKAIHNRRTLKKLTPEERAVYDACTVPAGRKHNIIDAIGIGLHHLNR